MNGQTHYPVQISSSYRVVILSPCWQIVESEMMGSPEVRVTNFEPLAFRLLRSFLLTSLAKNRVAALLKILFQRGGVQAITFLPSNPNLSRYIGMWLSWTLLS